MSTSSPILDRAKQEYDRMSSSGRLIALLGVALLVVLLWSELVAPISTSWGAAADDISQRVDRVDRAAAQAAAQRSNVVAYGPMVPPSQRATESQAMLEAVNDIMSEYGVRAYEFNESSSAVKVGGSTLPGIDRIKATLRFETAEEKAIEILGALENSTKLECISSARVQQGKAGGLNLTVEYTIGAWIRGGTRRGPTSRTFAAPSAPVSSLWLASSFLGFGLSCPSLACLDRSVAETSWTMQPMCN